MHAIILAAGVGSRLFGDSRSQPPKSLIEFDGRTLLARHFEYLQVFGVEKLTLVVGYRKDLVVAEAEQCSPPGFLEVIENPMYRGGSIISMWYARETYRRGQDVLFMDADILYDTDIIKRLIDSSQDSAFVYDDDLDEGDDPVRICLRDGNVVDFGKRIVGQFDAMGEWPGFMKVSADTGPLIAASLENYIEGGQLMSTYEEAIRDVVIGGPDGVFGIVDISDLNWIEIDFPEDLERAREVILPKLKT
ncbi:MAG: phosphocholine cytidylyltransferase family protein [Rhodospirillales bacterium]|nr:phosphocholine cytidylyltransferase family protein [Rhodospirillales bacterium]